MANFPDLVTTDIGIIAFWNAKDHWVGPGANTIDPTNCAGIFDSYSVYDNGIEGHKALGSGRYFHARVKSDGWMVAWIDRTNTFFYPNKEVSDFGENTHKGYYDILWDWVQSSNISTTQTTLSYLISLLYNALSNKADFTYTDADVGHYCYEFPEAAVITLISIAIPSPSSKTGYIQYTSGTNIHYAAVCGMGASENSNQIFVQFSTHMVVDWSSPGGGWEYRYGAADILSNNWMPNPLTDYSLSVYRAGGTMPVHGSLLIIWK